MPHPQISPPVTQSPAEMPHRDQATTNPTNELICPETFTDPSSGQVLGTRRKELGVLQLTGVEQKLAFGSFSPLEADAPKRGDLVVVMSE